MNATNQLFDAIKRSIEPVRQLLVNAPTSEWGVTFLLGQLSSQGTFHLVKGSGAFPDCILRVNDMNLSVELELTSSQYIRHRHPMEGCDAVVCWQKDAELPMPIIALREFYPGITTPDIVTIDYSRKQTSLAGIFEYLREWISGYGISPKGVPVRSETNTLAFLWGSVSLCSIQFCGVGSNEYVRFRFYKSALSSPSAHDAVIHTFKNLSDNRTIRYSPSDKEERIDLYPDVFPSCSSLCKELDLLMTRIV